MAKFDPSVLALPKRKTETRSFRDPEQPGAVLTLSLRRLLACEFAAAMDASDAYYEEWEGSEHPISDTGVTFYVGIPEPGKERDDMVYGGKMFIQTVHLIHAMQTGAAHERSSIEDLMFAFALMPEAFLAAQRFAGELNTVVEKEDDEGNPSSPPA